MGLCCERNQDALAIDLSGINYPVEFLMSGKLYINNFKCFDIEISPNAKVTRVEIIETTLFKARDYPFSPYFDTAQLSKTNILSKPKKDRHASFREPKHAIEQEPEIDRPWSMAHMAVRVYVKPDAASDEFIVMVEFGSSGKQMRVADVSRPASIVNDYSQQCSSIYWADIEHTFFNMSYQRSEYNLITNNC